VSTIFIPSTIDAGQCLLFTLDDQVYGLRLSAVRRVVHAVEITPLPHAPPDVLGIINVAGSIIAVVSVRRRFGLPEIAYRLSDRLVVARAFSSTAAPEGRLLALAVDAVLGVRDLGGEATIPSEKMLPGLDNLDGLAKTDLGIVLIYDLAMFLSRDDAKVLEAILPGRVK